MPEPAADQWAAGERLITALEYVTNNPAPPRPVGMRAVIDLGGRRIFDRAGDEVWDGVAAVVAQMGRTPLTFGECCRVMLLKWAFEESPTAAGGRRKRRLITGDPVLLTTCVVAFAHSCLRRASGPERHALLTAIAEAAAQEREPDA